MRSALVFVVGLLALAGCGSNAESGARPLADGDDVAVPTIADSPTADDLTTRPPTIVVAAGTTEPAVPDECESDREILELAAEVYRQRFGRYPAGNADLVGTILLDDIDSYAVLPDGALSRVPDASCVNHTTEPAGLDDSPESVDEVLAGLGAGSIAVLGGVDCATELAAIFVAGWRYEQETGEEPTNFSDVFAYADVPITRWRFDEETQMPAAVDGSGCLDAGFVEAESLSEDEEACAAERRTLETAAEAYYVQFGTDPADAQTLVDVNILRRLPISHDFVAGSGVQVIPGSPCDVGG